MSTIDAVRASFLEAKVTLDRSSPIRGTWRRSPAFAELCHAASAAGPSCWPAATAGRCATRCTSPRSGPGASARDRAALPAIAFSDPSQLTCIANDFGYDEVFARSVEAYGKPGDLLVAISTSGNSPNVLRAVERARQMGVATVGLLGKGGRQGEGAGRRRDRRPPRETSDRIQEVHIKVLHIAIEAVERELFPANYSTAR